MEKECKKCNIVKPFELFHKEKKNKDGFQRYCKECAKNANKQWYNDNKNKRQIVFDTKEKQCAFCKQVKKTNCFSPQQSSKDGFQQYCKDCVKAKGKIWREQNPDYFKKRYKSLSPEQKQAYIDSFKVWKNNNPEKCKEAYKRWRKKNKQRSYENLKRSRKRNYQINPTLRLTMSLRTRLYQALKGHTKADNTVNLLGCSLEFFKNHIAALFTEGMSWENYGKWHLDHIVPCSSFNLEDSQQQKLCFHYTNLQPLWAKDNIAKSNKLNWNNYSK